MRNLKRERVGGKGESTDRIIDELQNYYGKAIRTN